MAITITRTPWIDDDGTGTTGTVINNAEKQTIYNQIDAALAVIAPYGYWVDVPFNAANFSGYGGMTWTVAGSNVPVNHYTITGKTMTWSVRVQTSTVGGTLTPYLLLMIPAGATGRLASDGGVHVWAYTAVGNVFAVASIYGGNRQQVVIQNTDATNWVAGDLFLNFTITFELQ
jgi:hypothetical protein